MIFSSLNDFKYDYVDFKQLLSTVTCCTNRRESTLQKTNDTSSSGVSRFSRAWGETVWRCHQARSWQHKIKETLQSNALLATIQFQGQSFLAFGTENLAFTLSKA